MKKNLRDYTVCILIALIAGMIFNTLTGQTLKGYLLCALAIFVVLVLVRTFAKRIFEEYVESILIALILALLVRTFVMQAFKIPTGSMRPTLIEGDRILVSKFIYRFREPEPGEVIVFKYPEDPKRDFIKRLIATEGQKVQIMGGKVHVDGKPLEIGDTFDQFYYYNQGLFGRERNGVIVPEDSFFVLGDNSASSRDSRYWGFVPRRYLVGKAFFLYWPLTRIRTIR